MRALVLILMAGAMMAAPGTAQQSEPQPAGDSAERTGLTCAWTMMRTSVAVGRRCGVTANPGLQGTLEHSVSRIEEHVREHAPQLLAQMDERRLQIDGRATAELCTAGATDFYREMGEGEPEALRDETDRVIALPGPQEFGACE